MMTSMECSKDLVNGYVQMALQGISGERQEEIRQEVKKREEKLKVKKQQKKTLTVFKPFSLETSKRIKLDEDKETLSQAYEPLWLQVQKSFQLRDSTNFQPNQSQQLDVKHTLTVPKAPNLQTLQRMKLKDDFAVKAEDEEQPVFKARPLNMKIFDKNFAKLPSVERKQKTTFDEFSLSNSNNQLAKKTLVEYLHERENPQEFRARSLNKKILERAEVMVTPHKEKHLTEPAPFQFKTDERLKAMVRSSERLQDAENSKPGSVVFKAKAMPNYKFFQVKTNKDSAKKLLFKEFNLATANMKRVRSNSHEAEDTEQHQFHAQPMPDFSKPKTCVKKDLPIYFKDTLSVTKAEGFKLSTIERGEEKRSKFIQQIEDERKREQELAKFKAREFKPQDLKPIIHSGKTTPNTALLSIVKEFKLHSVQRCQQREEFDRKQREKEAEQSQQEQERLLEIKRKEEEEIKKIRSQMVFKASKIRKFRFVIPENSDAMKPKKLTQPVQPKLSTSERAHLKEDLNE